MNRLLAILLACGVALTSGAAQRNSFKHKHIPDAVSGLKSIGNLEATNRLHLAISLPVRNQPKLDALLKDLYDPASPRYRHWLTNGEFADKFGPTTNDYETVVKWAKTKGFIISERHGGMGGMTIEGSVSTIEKAFGVKMKKYRHPKEARNFRAPDREPTIDLSIPIQGIEGLDDYSPPKPASSIQPAGGTPAGGSGPSGYYFGNDYRKAYVPGTALTGSGQTVGILSFADVYETDVTAYCAAAGIPKVPITYVVIDAVAPLSPNNIESALDIELVNSMAPGLSQIYFYESTNALWLPIVSRMANDNLSRQLSCSWLRNYQSPECDVKFQQMASQGQSFFAASGDWEANSAYVFPHENPYVVSVGGTTLTTISDSIYSSEVVWNDGGGIGSGGGVSATYTIPSYQVGISMVLNGGSTTMKNRPDVACVARDVWVYYNQGTAGAVVGTSLATPLWAAFTALANQQAVAHGHSSVGFPLPALYDVGLSSDYAYCFHDITNGNNVGFNAVVGYDLCAGWGTPNGTNLINALADPLIISNSFTLTYESCIATNNAIDPGETVTNSLSLKNIGNANTTSLVVTLLAGSGVSNPGPAQTYGALTAGGAAVARPFGFIATGICGQTTTATFHLQDGTLDLGTITVSFPLGAFVGTTTILSQNFDSATPPALPAGWTTTSSGSQVGWTTSTTTNDTAANAAFVLDDPGGGVSELYSPVFTLTTGPSTLSFRHWYMMETGPGPGLYDGGALEININSTGWQDILNSGGSFVSGGYIGALNTHYSNPLAGRLAWTGNSSGFITTLVNLPMSAVGNVQLRWRYSGDVSIGKPGWYIDTVSIINNVYSCCK